MSRSPALARLLTALVATSLACSLPGLPTGLPVGSAVPPEATSGSSGEALEAGATPAGAAGTEEWVELEPPPPAGILDAVQAGVEAGARTYEDGLIASLKLFTGELPAEEIFDEPPSDLEGFGLLREAQRYLRQGGDPDAKQEIERLVSILGPTTERLLDHAQPAPTSLTRSPGMAAQSRLAEECEDLFPQYAAQGFPPGSGIKCLLYKEGGISGQTLRVFWPIAYFTQPEYADQAYAGMVKSFQTYALLQPHGTAAQMRGVDLLFVILPAVEDPTILAMVPSLATDDRCLITVYLGAIQQNEIAKSGPQDYGVFLQTIAHEMFHCFQVWNFPNHADADWNVQDWWGEGTAEYFSNVVYPAQNYEWRWLTAMAAHSANTSIVEMSYDNFGFFQYVGNGGSAAVLDLISKMPATGGTAEQAEALSGIGDMQDIFHNFGRAYMDGTLIDTSNAQIPTIPPYISPARRFTITEDQVWLLEAQPFVVDRYAITFPQGYRYTIGEEVKGQADGRHGARVDHSQGTWSTTPEQVATSCAPVTYFVLLTTSQTDEGPYSVQLTFNQEETLACDECLIGVWDLNEPSFQEYAEAPFAEIPDFYHYIGAGGRFRYTFRADGTMRGEFDFTYAFVLTQQNEPLGNDIRVEGTISIDGDGEGTYASSGVGHLTMSLAEDAVGISQTMYVNGEEMDVGDLGGLSNQPYGVNYGAGTISPLYSCDENSLYLNFVPESGTLPPLLFDRN